MPYDLSDRLVVGISSSALFDTRQSHKVFEDRGIAEYVRYQVKKEADPFPKGCAFPLVDAMLKLNSVRDNGPFEVVVMSQNEPDCGIRIMNSIDYYGLDITRSCFTGGSPVSNYLDAYNIALFLSTNLIDVQRALKCGVASGRIYDPPNLIDCADGELRLAFDGDAVLFSAESEQIYQHEGLDAFKANERRNAALPMAEGPFARFLRLISEIQNRPEIQDFKKIRTAVVTARNGPADKRVIVTLRHYGIPVNELFFMGGVPKDKVLRQFRPHIFFDDQDAHVGPAAVHVPSALVPSDLPQAKPPLASAGERKVLYRRISKKELERECRAVFQPYLPANQTNLTPEMKEFIHSASVEPPEARRQILDGLRKYCLRDQGIGNVSLNRQGVVHLKKKLMAILHE